jgi:hypothetical protein
VSATAVGSTGSPAGTATTGSNGEYVITGLTPGSYLVDFGGCGTLPDGYQAQWYQDQTSEATATPVTVEQKANTKRIDASLIN